MQPLRRIRTFSDRYPLVGPSFWLLSVQYFLTQYFVARAWRMPFSLRFNTISDLGNSACGAYAGRYVCSPDFSWMDASFIVLGVSMILGSGLIYHKFRRSSASRLGFTAMALAGFGTVLVGLFPENTTHYLHFVGALLPFLIGNLGLIILGLSLDISKGLKIYTILSGGIALVGFVLFITRHYLGLEIGGMERVTAYPQTLWLIVFGLYMSKNHFRRG